MSYSNYYESKTDMYEHAVVYGLVAIWVGLVCFALVTLPSYLLSGEHVPYVAYTMWIGLIAISGLFYKGYKGVTKDV